MICDGNSVDLWAVTKLGIAIIILAIALLCAVAILRGAYDIWMGNTPKNGGK